jgi:hypothetical protein
MSEKKLRPVLTAFVIAASLFLTSTAPADAAERGSRRAERSRVVGAAEGGLPGFQLWSILSRIWQKSGARIDPNGEKNGARIDPNGGKSGARIDPNGRLAEVVRDGEH